MSISELITELFTFYTIPFVSPWIFRAFRSDGQKLTKNLPPDN